MRSIFGYALPLLVCAATQASASDRDLTMSSSVAPVFRNGELEGCAAVFDVVHRDFEYRQGKHLQISGSVNYNVWPDREAFVSLKLGVRSLETPDESFEAPVEAYLVLGNQTNKAERLVTLPGEMDGFRLFGFRADGKTLESLMHLAETGDLQFGYAMRPGGSLSLVSANMRIKDANLQDPSRSEVDGGAPKRWLGCLSDATEAGLRRLKKK